MGKNFATSWQILANLLQECSTGSAYADLDAALSIVPNLLAKLEQLPMAPKAMWKKLVQLQVPSQLGAAFTAAAQHSWRSQATQATVCALSSLVRTASRAGIIHIVSDRSSSSLQSSIREQLQQSGMLQQLSAVITAMTEGLEYETAALVSGDWDAAGGDIQQFIGVNTLQSQFAAVALLRRQLWAFGQPQGLSESVVWLWSPNDDAGDGMHLATAALQHASSIVQHVLPAVRERSQQLAASLLGMLRQNSEVAWSLFMFNLTHVPQQQGPQQQQQQQQQRGQFNQPGVWQQLLLTPYLLPCVGVLVVIVASYLDRYVATHCSKVGGSSAGQSRRSSSSRNSSSCCGPRTGSSSSSGGPSTSRSGARRSGSSSGGGPGTGSSSSGSRDTGSSSSSTTGQLERQQRCSSPDGNTCSGITSESFTACQLQLLQLLRIAPEVVDWALQNCESFSREGVPSLHSQLETALNACKSCCATAWQQLHNSSTTGSEEQQQRWQFEWRLWQLLPTVLLPCASSLLLPGATRTPGVRVEGTVQQQQQQVEGTVQQLLRLSEQVTTMAAGLHSQLDTLGVPCATAPAAWVDEQLGVLLQLADQLLYRESLKPAAAAAAAVTHEPTGSSSSTSTRGSASASTSQQSPAPAAAPGPTGDSSARNSARNSTTPSTTPSTSQHAPSSACAGHLLMLLANAARESQALRTAHTSNANRHGHDSAAVPGDVPPVAKRFVEFVSALEVALRAVAAAMQSSALSTCICLDGQAIADAVCLCVLMPHDGCVLVPRDGRTSCMLLQHMGCRGPVALVQEQQQLYSLLSTLQKLNCCVRPGAQKDWGEQVAAGCCLAAGHAAVGLLKLPSAAGARGLAATEQPVRSPAAVAAVPMVSYLPSLVIFGRCLLQWAEQLQQRVPEQQHQHGTPQVPLFEFSAARVCIPGCRQGSVILPGEWMESLVATVAEWVGGIDSPAIQQLTAAGCSPQQLQQQLDALLAAQQGTQQGLTDASLAALVQQLQVTGAMLSSISVPHFCNNPACANLSGPTEVRLVSGRSCVCAGCLVARYCGRACQRAAWKQHKRVCKSLAAAASTAATGS